MKKLDNLPDKGLLHAEAGRTKFSLTRYAPSEDLAPFVEHYWLTEWDLQGQPPYRQFLITHPCVNLVFEQDGRNGCYTGVHGIRETSDSRLLEGKGKAIGIKFKPGGFYPFWQQPMTRLTGTSVSCGEMFGVDMGPIERQVFNQRGGEQIAAAAENFLRERLPARVALAELATEIVEAVSDNRQIAKSGDLSELFGMSLRSLQRIFNQYIGISPKWVIRRFRLHEAAERMEKGDKTDWTELAAQLGYFDQAHFIRDFKAVAGKTPSAHLQANSELRPS